MTAVDTSTTLVVRVVGHTPAPQGSMTAVRGPSGVSVRHSNRRTGPWRDAVVEAARSAMRAAGWVTLDGPVVVDLSLALPRPRSVRRVWPSVAPDLDKLARSCLDALTTAEVYRDDALVVDLHARKRYAPAGSPAGALIRISTKEAPSE